MVVIGVDDTDSRSAGMCTTWIATEIVRRLPPGAVERTALIRLNPAIEHKTRGNGAVAIETTASTDTAFSIGRDVIDTWAVAEDPDTNPGLVVADRAVAEAAPVRTIAENAIRTTVERQTVDDTLESLAVTHQQWANGRGLIGATAAIGAIGARNTEQPLFRDWTYEWLVYREPDRWGTPRTVATPSEEFSCESPAVWDTIDPVTNDLACVPHSPCPVLFGIRGDDPHRVRAVGEQLTGEPKARGRLFETNQGTDAHLRPGGSDTLVDGACYRVRGAVIEAPETQRGGHVRMAIEVGDRQLPCYAFAPTGPFRDHVRALVPGDDVLVCGELGEGTLKLEKFALVRPVLSDRVTPTCPDCDRRMKSAGRNQGYRCRDCGTSRAEKELAALDRDIERGWYEVPPIARRHLAKPLIRGNHALPIPPTA